MANNGRTPHIWPNKARTQQGTARLDAAVSDHLNSTADPYFVAVRDLLERWIGNYPAESRADLAGRLRARDDDQIDAAFWELYLHEAYKRAGHQIEVHPPIPGTSRSPDFRIDGFDGPFYVEATSLRRSAGKVSKDNRLSRILEVLRSKSVRAPFRVELRYRVGRSSPSGREVLAFLQEWFETLDHDEVVEAYKMNGISRLPVTTWKKDGWILEFRAFPGSMSAAEGVVYMSGPRQPSKLDYHETILSAARSKAKAYGALDSPLVIALQINTEYHADDHFAEQALYGLHLPHPPEDVPTSDTLQKSESGLWIGPDGYLRDHVPQVITASNLHIGHLTTQPRIWPHPDPSVRLIQHPGLFASIRLGPAKVLPATPPGNYFELDPILRQS